jgi:hypothetical protein
MSTGVPCWLDFLPAGLAIRLFHTDATIRTKRKILLNLEAAMAAFCCVGSRNYGWRGSWRVLMLVMIHDCVHEHTTTHIELLSGIILIWPLFSHANVKSI